ncbi:iron-containing redox enzyme family protein [Oleiagrimonas sp. C23AA]|uniref:TenA family transcriptional regulator n=1 Tax=Oleiagrimonas sp. C23AA TaxID=2719047 RepID=UPI00141F91A6|nr:iron-containing redox enzyme family protein [Oleiagrimonas sp. C23AA]NII10566.1 iron-containing redox enzyme family protein [Oleiagrimonas sp. C23AA]
MPMYDRLVSETAAAREQFLAIPVIQRALQGQVSRQEYVAFLGQAYHHVHQTVPLLMATGAYLPERLDWMRAAMAEYIEEEQGHDAWVLDDITACGGDAAQVRQARPLPATELMIAYAHDTVRRGNPVGFLGMVFVLEGTSAALASQAAEALRQALDLPARALRYLSSHGALDQAHVGFYEQLVNGLDDPRDQDALIHAANMFYHLYGNVFRAVATPRPH